MRLWARSVSVSFGNGSRRLNPTICTQITWDDLQAAERAVGEFGGDNRAGVQVNSGWIPHHMRRLAAPSHDGPKPLRMSCREPCIGSARYATGKGQLSASRAAWAVL